jgi:hypothetical protein
VPDTAFPILFWIRWRKQAQWKDWSFDGPSPAFWRM